MVKSSVSQQVRDFLNGKITKENMKEWGFYLMDTLLDLVIIFVIIWIVRAYIVSPFRVSGESMLDTLYNNDFILVNKLSYRDEEPSRGDVVVVRPPTNPDIFYVKRVIALPGERLQFRDGDVYVINTQYPNGMLLTEPYLNDMNRRRTALPDMKERIIKIPPGSYFVMGDNRTHSTDSRRWEYDGITEGGAIPRENIVGKGWVVLFPSPRIIQHINYEETSFNSSALNFHY